MKPFWKKTANEQRKAVCFFNDRIDVASVSRRGDRRQIDQLDSYSEANPPLPALQRLRKTLGVGACSTLMRLGEYQLLQLDALEGDSEERKSALRWKIKDMVDFPVENATLDVFDIRLEGPASNRGKQCYVVVCNNATLMPKIRLFQEAKLHLDVVDIPELAQRNVAALFEQENRGLVCLNFTSEGGLLTFTFKGELYVVRRIEIAIEQLEQADETRRTDLFDRIALEVQRSVDNFERMFNFITLSRLITPELPSVPGLLAYLRGYLSLAVAPLDLAEVLDFPAIPELRNPRRQAECLLSIGAALREEPV